MVYQSDIMKAGVISELEGGREFTEAEALVKLLEISSQEVEEGKTITGDQLMVKLKTQIEGVTK
jgi:hypothetical protein